MRHPSTSPAPVTPRPVPPAPPCGICRRPVEAFRELVDDVVRTAHDRVPRLWSLPRRGAAAERRTAELTALMTALFCGAPAAPGGRPEALAVVHACLDRVVATGAADLLTALRLVQLTEVVLNRWLWDTRWPMPVAELAAGTRRIAAVGRALRTDLVLGRCRRSGPAWTDLLLGQVLVVDDEAARAAAGRLGPDLDLDTTWYVVAGRPHHARWLHDVPAAELATGSPGDRGWLLAAATARAVLPRLHEALSAAGEPLAVVGPVTAEELRAGVAHAVQLARLAGAARLRGVVRRADVLLEAAVVRAPQALAGLAGLVRRLDGPGPELRTTVERFYANDLNRTRTARDLGIHRSTLEYRLARVHRLTGLHPDSTRGVQVLATALAAAALLADRPDTAPDTAPDGTGRAATADVPAVTALRPARPRWEPGGTSLVS